MCEGIDPSRRQTRIVTLVRVSRRPRPGSGLPRDPGLFRLGDNLVDLPRFLEYDCTEKSERADHDFERTGRELSFAGQVHLVGANLVGSQGRRDR